MGKAFQIICLIIFLLTTSTSAPAKYAGVQSFFDDSLSIEAKAKTNIHLSFDNLLKKYVSTDGKVNYQGFLKEKTKLQAYIKSLQNININKLSKNEQLAFWINVYNAATIDQILRNFPVKSIKDIANGKVWDKNLPYKFKGKVLSLNDIEYGKLLQTFNDPRIHFAINCAAKSCPKLNNRAFSAQNVQQMLNANTAAFLNNTDQNIITKDKVKLSQIFNWFKEDFTKGGASVMAFVNKFSKQKIDDKQNISFLDYDWDLNGK